MVKEKMDHIGVGLVCALLLLVQYGNGATVNVTSPNPSPHVLTGDTINLTISYSSTPILIIWAYKDIDNLLAVWTSGEKSIDDKYKNRLTLQENQISIRDSTPADSGVYLVRVRDASRNSGEYNFTVDVRGAEVPKIQSNDTGIFKTGESISLAIWYSWEPLSIVWNYNGSPLIVSANDFIIVGDRFKGRANITDNGSLLVYNNTNEDAGIYTVTVTSNVTSASRSFQVKFYDVISGVTVQQTPAIVDERTPDVNLSCGASSGSGSVTWQKDGQPLSNDSSHVLLDRVLQILNPNRTFSGTYSCNMSNPVSWNVGFIVMTVYYPVEEVTVTKSPEIVSEMTPLVNLSCSATRGLGETVTWMKDGQSIINDDKHNLLDGNRILQIIQPNRTFSGNYSCKMSNAAYWDSGSLDLLVYDPVENVIVTQSPKILDGNSTAVNLSCSASSTHIEAVTWKKDGEVIEGNDTFTLLDGNHTLQIIDSKRTFGGLYNCTVSNAAYQKIVTHQVRIYDPIENVTVTQSPKIASESSPAVNLSCGASRGYIESVTWTKDGKPITTSNNSYNLLNENRVLQINKPNKTFSGLYSCNMFNAAYWKPGSLQLRVYDPVLNVEVTQSPDKVTVETPLVKLSCSDSGAYIEKVAWTKDGKAVSSEKPYSLSDGNKVLQITEPDKAHSGIYTCTMSNAAYSGSKDINLTVSGATPGATVTFGLMIITLLGGLLLAH
ncbi:hemicentin-1-like [Rana temporaria]|uniref:hemicentin-1-like n=1 Tax=Rana temporaria TaxID=8407 RepID=UPI001AAD9B87|nr:hemicentin-1-like [Rana temporaria]